MHLHHNYHNHHHHHLHHMHPTHPLTTHPSANLQVVMHAEENYDQTCTYYKEIADIETYLTLFDLDNARRWWWWWWW